MAKTGLKPECFRCQKELSDWGYCEDCKNTCPICDGTGKSIGVILGGDRDIPLEKFGVSIFLRSLAELLDLVLGPGGSIHHIAVSPLETKPNHIRVRIVGHKFVRSEAEAESLKKFEFNWQDVEVREVAHTD